MLHALNKKTAGVMITPAVFLFSACSALSCEPFLESEAPIIERDADQEIWRAEIVRITDEVHALHVALAL